MGAGLQPTAGIRAEKARITLAGIHDSRFAIHD
jgi:hypothetical protein